MRRVLIVLTASACLPATAGADPGDRDRTFGRDGMIRIPRVSAPAGPVVLSGDRIVVADRTTGTVYGLTASGRTDAGFGESGELETAGVAPQMTQIVRHGDGFVVAAGRTGTYTLTRFTARGAVDPAFGEGGTVTVRGPWHGARHVAAAPDGTLVVSYFTVPPYVARATGYVARHTARGALDERFGDRGVATLAEVVALAVFPRRDGILVAVTPLDGPQRLTLRRLTLRGDADRGFTAVALPGWAAFGTGSAGALGWVATRPRRATGLLRPDGTLHPASGPRPADDYVELSPQGVVPEPGARLVYTAWDEQFGLTFPSGLSVFRASASGARDRTFGNGGRARLARPRDRTTGPTAALAADAAGRIVVLALRRIDEGDREDIGGFDPDRSFALVARLEGGVPRVRVRSARRRAGTVRVRVACLRAAPEACTGRVVLDDARRRHAGSERVSVRRGAARTITVLLTRRPRGRLVADARITDGAGRLATHRRRVR